MLIILYKGGTLRPIPDISHSKTFAAFKYLWSFKYILHLWCYRESTENKIVSLHTKTCYGYFWGSLKNQTFTALMYPISIFVYF